MSKPVQIASKQRSAATVPNGPDARILSSTYTAPRGAAETLEILNRRNATDFVQGQLDVMVGNSGEFKPKYAHLGDGVFTIYDYDRSNILGRGPADRSFRISAVLAIRHAADEEGTPTSPNTSVEFTVLVAADGVENLKRQRSVSPLTTVAAELERAAVQAPSLPQHPALHRQPTRLVLSEHDAADGDGGGGVDSPCNTDNHRVVTFKFRASNSHLKNTFVFLLIRNIKLYIYDPATRLQQPAGVGGGGRHGLAGGPSAAAGAAAGGSTGAADHHLASHDLGGVSRPSVVDRFIKGQHLDSSSDAESVASAGSGSDGGGGDGTPNALMSEMAVGGGASRGNRGQAAAGGGGGGAHRPAFFPGPSTGIGASGASAFTAAGGGSRGLPIGTRSAEAAQRNTSTVPSSIVNKDYAISQSLRTGPAPQWASASYAAGAAGATGAGPAFPSAFGGGIGLGGLGLQRQGALGMPASSSSSSFSGVSSNGGGVRAFGSGIGIGALPRIMSVPTEGAEDAHSATYDADGSTTGREGGPAGEDAAAAPAAAADDATASSSTSSSSSSDASDSDDADDDEGVFGALGSAGGAAQAKHHKTKQRRTVRATGRVAALQRSQSTDSIDSIDDTMAAMQRRMQRQQSPPLTAVAAAAIPPPAPAAAAPVVATAAAQPGAWKRRARLQPSSTYPETSPEHRSPPPVMAQPTRSPLQRSMTAASSSSGQLAQHHHNAGHQAQQLQLQQAPQLVPQTHIGEGEGGSQYGVWCAQGGRSRMEDAHIMCSNLLHYASTSAAAAAEGAQSQQQQQQPEQDGAAGVAARLDRTSYFAIFDGHGGTSAAEFAKENVVKAVVASLLQQQQQGSAVAATDGSASADPTVTTDVGHAAAGAGGSTQHGHSAPSHPHPLPLPTEVRDIDVAFQHAFRVVDEALLRSADAEVASGTKDRDRRCKSGTTALAVVLRGSDVVVASLGDCRAVMARPMRHGAGAASAAALPLPVSPQQQQQLTALRQLGYESVEVLSIEHTPANEVLRIRAAGGWVTSEKEVSVAKLQHMDLSHPLVQRRLQAGMESIIEHQISRLCGELGVSRALGDAEYKGVARMATYEHWAWPASKGPDERRFTADLVLSAPDIVHARLPIGGGGSSSGSSTSASVAAGAAGSDGAWPDHHHEQLQQQQPSSPGHASAAAAAASSSPPPFLILACDGLWDVMSSEDAVEIAAGYMHSVRLRGVQRAADGGDAQPQGREEESLPMGAARQLVHMALKLGTSDNVTAMVVMLPS